MNLQLPPISPDLLISSTLTGLVKSPLLLLIQRSDSAVEMWGLTGREGGAGTGWHGHIW